MKLKCKLEQAIINEQERSINLTYIFKPILEQYKKEISFKVKGGNTPAIMENLKLPCTIGDTIILEMTLKEEQSKLPEKEKDVEKDKGKAGKSGS